MSMIVKNFVMINFILQIDTMYGEGLPDEVNDLVDDLNGADIRMPVDNFSYSKVMFRLYKHKNDVSALIYNLVDLMINMWYSVVMEFSIIIYNYFGGIMVIVIQMVGYMKQNNQIKGVNH